MRFLLVDDNHDDRDLMVYAIGEAHSFEVAGSLAEAFVAIERAEATHGQFDAILLDLGLPDSEGERTFERMHQRVRPTPIVVFSGHEDLSIARKLLTKGASNYIAKIPQLRSEVVVFQLEQAALHARSQSAAEIEMRTAARIASDEADALERVAKSLPPKRGSPMEAHVGHLSTQVGQMMTTQVALVRVLSSLVHGEARQNRELADQRDGLTTAELAAMSAQEAAKTLARDVAEIRLRDLSPRSKKVLAGSVLGIITTVGVIFEGLRQTGILERLLGP